MENPVSDECETPFQKVPLYMNEMKNFDANVSKGPFIRDFSGKKLKKVPRNKRHRSPGVAQTPFRKVPL